MRVAIKMAAIEKTSTTDTGGRGSDNCRRIEIFYVRIGSHKGRVLFHHHVKCCRYSYMAPNEAACPLSLPLPLSLSLSMHYPL